MPFPPFRSEIANRIVSALALLPLVIWLLWRGGWCSALLLAAAGGLAAREYYRLTLGHLALPGWLGVAGATVLPTLPQVMAGFAATAALAVIGLVSVEAWIHHVLLGPRAEGPTRVGHIVAGLLFISLGLLPLSALRAGPDGLPWASAVLAASWGNDTAAFCVGKMMGRHKLLPAVSPGKTWEGLFGGLLGAVAALIGVQGMLSDGLSWRECLGLGLLTSIFGPLGDLSKSMLKRTYHVKDSGRLIPGHGGMLDRIDAILFNAPVVLLLQQMFRN